MPLGETDPILALGATVAHELYGAVLPVVVLSDPSDARHLVDAGEVVVEEDHIRLARGADERATE